jgi:hypothetical protein
MRLTFGEGGMNGREGEDRCWSSVESWVSGEMGGQVIKWKSVTHAQSLAENGQSLAHGVLWI